MKRILTRLVSRQDGVVVAMVAVMMVMLMGLMAIVVDAGRLFVERTQLQQAVDAAALAGAQAIGTGSSSASAAASYASQNGVDSAELIYNGPASSLNPDDSWKVSASRTVGLTFAQFLGLTQSNVVATATAINSPLLSIDASQLLPYGLWGGNPNPVYNYPNGLQDGNQVVYRDNQWPENIVVPDPNNCGKKNQPPCNPNWQVGPQTDFKGFLHNLSGTITVGSTVDVAVQGGNGSEPTNQICQLANSNPKQPAIFPVIGKAVENSGTIALTIVGFRAVYLDPISGCGGKGGNGSPYTGTIDGDYDFSGGTPGGPPDPNGVHVLKLWR